jgi:hypothetical protein
MLGEKCKGYAAAWGLSMALLAGMPGCDAWAAPMIPASIDHESATSDVLEVRAVGRRGGAVVGPRGVRSCTAEARSWVLEAAPIVAGRPSSALAATSRFVAPPWFAGAALGFGRVGTIGPGAEPSPPAPPSAS